MRGAAPQKEDYSRTLEYLFGLQRFGIKLGLANVTTLLNHLGNPHHSWPAVHVAGTNGKGSTAAFLASMLRQAGYRVGLYTSPHLIDFSERIQVGGVPIPIERVISLTTRIREVIQKVRGKGRRRSIPVPEGSSAAGGEKNIPVTFFEFTTALAFLYFQEENVDLAILETGMGGRLDATNVVDPLLSIITTISLEHQQYLGGTLEEIAAEKAGIIKPHRPLLTSVQDPEILALLEKKCRALGAPLFIWNRDFSLRKKGPQSLDFRGRKHRWTHLRLGLAGSHQLGNAALALGAIEVLEEEGFPAPQESLRRGLAGVEWPGRLEMFGRHPKILLDGAHNAEATQALRNALLEGFPRQKLILVMGIMADKAIGPMMSHLVPLADLLILTRPAMERAASLETMRSQAAPFGKPIMDFAPVDQAIAGALREAQEEDLILVCGSLYTVGAARAFLQRKEGDHF